MGEISVGERFAGHRLGDLMAKAPAGLQVTMVRKGGRNIVPTDDTILENGDAVLVVAEDSEAIATAAAKLGKLSPGQLASDRADLDYIRVFVGKASVVGIPLAQLPMPAGYPTHLLHVRRYDADLVPAPDLMLEFGDRVGVLAPPDRKEEIRRHFGDTVKATAEFSYVSLGLGMVMGVLLGLIPIPIPGVGIVTLGIGGGPLIVALILGKLRRTGPMLWTMPLPANIVLRNFGLAMFLATVGVNAGQPFVRTVAESGFTMLFIGVAVLLTTVAIVLLVGHYRYEDSIRRPRRRRVRRNGKSGHPRLLDQDGPDRAARHRIRHDLSFDDAGEGDCRADHRSPDGRQRRLARRCDFPRCRTAAAAEGRCRYRGNSRMDDRAPAPQPPVFNSNAYSPAEIKEAVEKVGVKKARLPFLASFMLAIVAGGSIGLGALYYTIVASDAELSFATGRVLGGLVFSLGLALVIVGGAELFTGNNLIVMAWASRKVTTGEMLRNWLIVYLGNLVGALGVAVLVLLSHHLDMNGGRIGLSILNTAVAKIQPDVFTLFYQGHPVQRACLPGGLACLCGAVGHRQDPRAHTAGLGLRRGRFRALRGQHVFPAAGLADDQHGQGPRRLRCLRDHVIRDHS